MNHVFISFSAVQIYEFSYIHLYQIQDTKFLNETTILVTKFLYVFSCTGRSSRAMNAIRAGMKMWSDNTCIKFRERRGNEGSYANFQTGGG